MDSNSIITTEFVSWLTQATKSVATRRRWFVDTGDVIQNTLTRLHRYILNGAYKHSSVAQLKAYTRMLMVGEATNLMRKKHREDSRIGFHLGGFFEDGEDFDLAEDRQRLDTLEKHEFIEWALDVSAHKIKPIHRRIIELTLGKHRPGEIVRIMQSEGFDINSQKLSKKKRHAINVLRKLARRE